MRRMLAGLLMTVWTVGAGSQEAAIPESFPSFTVPGREKEMESLRQLFWNHYQTGGPMATLWDEWLSSPTLWPAVQDNMAMHTIRERWRKALTERSIDSEGYVATHQHASIAHPQGWPFPFWRQGQNTWGWHFATPGLAPEWHATEPKTQEGWTLERGTDNGIHDEAWHVALSEPQTRLTAPEMAVDAFEAPFLQLRWNATRLGTAQPYVEWITDKEPEFGADRRFHFYPVEQVDIHHMVIPVYRHPKWQGRITRLRIGFNNTATGGEVGIQSVFTTYDTRHNINNSNFVRGCTNYFLWTGDLNFLRENLDRMRTAIRFAMREFDTVEEGVVVTRWVGHEGRSGIKREGDKKTLLHGNGIGSNYWDLLPMGYKDAYATMHFYDAVRAMAEIERAVREHPGWQMPGGALALSPETLEGHAEQLKREGNRIFWNDKTGRFFCAIDADGVGHDYGFTFLNLEAIHYGFATDEHAASIMSWMSGERVVDGDTSQGADIYFWRFGPRATTKRNVDYYFWGWSNPESLEFGDQVQDGGAVLGFAYHDYMARLKTRGADDAAARLNETAKWFDEVMAAGGYRKYYDGSRPGKLQGGGTAGGLGCDMEFFESILAPQVVIDGFLGFKPTADGFSINPKLPSDWPELTVNRIHLKDAVLRIRATRDSIDVTVTDVMRPGDLPPLVVSLPQGTWTAEGAQTTGGSIDLAVIPAQQVRLTRTP